MSEEKKDFVREVFWNDLNYVRFYMSMPLVSLTVRTIVFPFQLLKTHSQTQVGKTGLVRTARAVYNSRLSVLPQTTGKLLLETRLRALTVFYKGFGVSLFGLLAGPMYATVLELSRQKLRTDTALNQVWISALSGLSAGFFVQLYEVPIDVISQRRMVFAESFSGVSKVKGKNGKYGKRAAVRRSQMPSVIAMSRRLVASDGFFSLWRGLNVTLLSYMPMSATVWAVNTWCKDELFDRMPTAHWSSVALLSGTSAGVCAATLTMPFDTIRTRKQVLNRFKSASIGTVFRDVIATYGFAGLYRGLFARITSVSIHAGIILTFYDALKRYSSIC